MLRIPSRHRARKRGAFRTIALLALLAACPCLLASDATSRWTDDWEVVEGFALDVDATGFELPTSIAFVPEPADDPDAPLYFVSELRGRLKVVTRDRRVHVFADDFVDLRPLEGRADERVPEVGLTGLGIHGERGFIFVTYGYHDEGGFVRYGLRRYRATPGTFSIEPEGFTDLSSIFEGHLGDDAHTIGPALVVGDELFVNVGDSHAPSLTQSPHMLNGKVLRMSLDGEPLPDNPFYIDHEHAGPRNYVYAVGFRNPFGIRHVRGQLFVTDVGPGVDRFLRIEKGQNYGYDGSDWSISSHADVVFAPSVSPVGFDYVPEDSEFFPESFRDSFFIATSGLQGVEGPSDHGEKAILYLKYDFESHRVRQRPRELMRYRGSGRTMLVSAAVGPDGLYVVPLEPNPASPESPILKLRHDPQNAHPHILNRSQSLMTAKGCHGCHRDTPGAPAPRLRRDELVSRILPRLESPDYESRSRALDERDEEPFANFRDARREVREASGTEKVRKWIKYRLLQPRFDDPEAKMPDLSLTGEEAEVLARYLAAGTQHDGFLGWLQDWMSNVVPYPRQRHLYIFFGVGFLCALVVVTAGLLVFAKVRRRKQRVAESVPTH